MSLPTGSDSLWKLLIGLPGVGVSITNTNGELLYLNDIAMDFVKSKTFEYQGKTLWDMYPKAVVEERLELLRKAVSEKRPIVFRHVNAGRRIESTMWPLADDESGSNRVISVSRRLEGDQVGSATPYELVESQFVDLGRIDSLSKRELEVLVLLGQGLSVPAIAKSLHRSPKTIERHKTSIGKKLTLQSQAEIVRLVAAIGLQLDDVQKIRLQPTGDLTVPPRPQRAVESAVAELTSEEE